MILLFCIFSILNIFCFFFNCFLFILIYYHFDKNRIPVVYIYNLLISGNFEIVTMCTNFLVPILLDDATHNTGPYVTIISTFSYEHPLYLSLLMIIQRIFIVLNPTSQLFNNKNTWIYCFLISVFSMISLLIPFFSDCYITANQRTTAYEAACDGRHPITLLQNKYLIVIPLFSMVLNILFIIYLSIKKKILIEMVNNVNKQLTNRQLSRQKFEKNLLIQSISTTFFLVIFELTGVFIRTFPTQYNSLSSDLKLYIYYSRLSSSSILAFCVFFVATPSTRHLIIDRFKIAWKQSSSTIIPSVISVNRIT